MDVFFKKFGAAYRMIGVLIITIMVLTVFINAVMRYAFNAGFIATEEMLRYLFIYMSFLGIVEVAYQREHISVTILTDALKGRVRTFVYFAGYILMLFATYVLVDGTIMYYEESESSVGQVTGIPFRVIIASLLFGALGLMLFTLRDLVLSFKAFLKNEEFPPRPVNEDIENAVRQLEASVAANEAEQQKETQSKEDSVKTKTSVNSTEEQK